MAICGLLTERCKSALEELAKEEGFETFEITAGRGSSEGENFLGEIIKVVISGKKNDGSNGRLNLVTKISLKTSALRENSFIQQFYKREIAVYTKMLPALEKHQKNLPDADKFLYPKLYKSWMDENDEFLIMEDLNAKNFVMVDRQKSYDYDHLVMCIKNMAAFHATSIAWRASDPEAFEEMSSHSITLDLVWVAMTQYLGKSVPTAREIIKGKPYESVMESFLDNLIKDMDTLWTENLTLPYGVLCHGDSWSNNIFFSYHEGKVDKMVFLDWQLMRKSSPVVDVAYILTSGLDSEMRSKYYYQMIDMYYEMLASNVSKMGVDINKYYPESLYRADIKKYMKTGFIISFGLLPLTLSTKGEAQNIIDYVQENETKFTPSEAFRTRLQELIEDSLKYNMI